MFSWFSKLLDLKRKSILINLGGFYNLLALVYPGKNWTKMIDSFCKIKISWASSLSASEISIKSSVAVSKISQNLKDNIFAFIKDLLLWDYKQNIYSFYIIVLHT